MEYRRLGSSGLKVPALSFGAGTFGGKGPLFSAWGSTDTEEARRLIDICLEAGVNLFDTADVYSDGRFGGCPRSGDPGTARRRDPVDETDAPHGRWA